MKKIFLFLFFFLTATNSYGLVINHNHTDITSLTELDINQAKSSLHIVYGHTSHGSQLITGMDGLITFANNGGKGLSLPTNIFSWNNGGTNGALDLHDRGMAGDVGYYPQWYSETVEYLEDPANSNVNVVMWSWCGQVSGKYASGTLTSQYLQPMSDLEALYPNVIFVYMTGHLDHWADANNKAANQMIRDYCATNNKVLYDFADIESYNPDGTFFEYAHDSCDYYSSDGNYLGNWAEEWRAGHTENDDWYSCSSAHSDALNANQKAYAAWHLFVEIARIINDVERYTLTINSSGVNSVSIDGTPSVYDGITNYSVDEIVSGASITLTAPASSGNGVFSSWTGCNSTFGNDCTIVMTSNTAVTANYIIPTYTLTVNSYGTSALSVNGTPASYGGVTNYAVTDVPSGTNITLTAPDASGDTRFTRWSGCSSTSGTSCVISMTADTNCTVFYGQTFSWLLFQQVINTRPPRTFE